MTGESEGDSSVDKVPRGFVKGQCDRRRAGPGLLGGGGPAPLGPRGSPAYTPPWPTTKAQMGCRAADAGVRTRPRLGAGRPCGCVPGQRLAQGLWGVRLARRRGARARVPGAWTWIRQQRRGGVSPSLATSPGPADGSESTQWSSGPPRPSLRPAGLSGAPASDLLLSSSPGGSHAWLGFRTPARHGNTPLQGRVQSTGGSAAVALGRSLGNSSYPPGALGRGGESQVERETHRWPWVPPNCV